MYSSIFWDITLCSLLNFNRRFRGTYLLRLQGRTIHQARNQLSFLRTSCWISVWFILQSCKWRLYVPPKRRLEFKILHGFISQKIERFITWEPPAVTSLLLMHTIADTKITYIHWPTSPWVPYTHRLNFLYLACNFADLQILWLHDKRQLYTPFSCSVHRILMYEPIICSHITVRLSALRAGRPSPPQEDSSYSFLLEAESTPEQ
jgi:hypothetical protein